jgi:anti-anti-sigma factor
MNSQIEIIEPSEIFNVTKGNKLRCEVNEMIKLGVKVILIDMKNVKFIDSSGIGALVMAMKITKQAEIKLFICSVNDQVRIIFEVSKMDRIFQILKDREEFQQQILAPQ